MASFDKYYPVLQAKEGGYMSAEIAKKAGDRGGETYSGITRNFNPKWAGWLIIDRYKKQMGKIPFNFKIKDAQLEALVKNFAQAQHWDIFELDDIQNQSLANQIADFGLNSGTPTVIKYVQKLLNLKLDGKIGTSDVAAINKADQAKLHALIKSSRVAMIQGSTKIKATEKPKLITRANSFQFSQTA